MASIHESREVLTSDLALDLEQWFDRILRLFDDSIFDIPRDDAHRRALLSDLVSSSARDLWASELDERGSAYTTTCTLLAALTRRLQLEVRREHWKAAIENVASLRRQLGDEGAQRALGLDLGTPVSLFRRLMYEALRNASAVGEVAVVDEKSRKLALGVALNWGLRFLLAYALQARRHRSAGAGCQDLSWLRERLNTVVQ